MAEPATALKKAQRIVILSGPVPADNPLPVPDGPDLLFVLNPGAASGRTGISDTPTAQARAALARTRTTLDLHQALNLGGRDTALLCLSLADLGQRARHLHVRNTIHGLFKGRGIPIVGPDETTSAEGFRPGYTWNLALQLVLTLGADLLLVLGDKDLPSGPARDGIDRLNRAGTAVYSTAWPEKGGLKQILTGDCEGEFHPARPDPFDPNRWEALTLASRGTLTVTDGYAARLLAGRPGPAPEDLVEVRGRFDPGAQVNLEDRAGNILAVGLSNYPSPALNSLKGLKPGDITGDLGYIYYSRVIGSENLTLPGGKGGPACLLPDVKS